MSQNIPENIKEKEKILGFRNKERINNSFLLIVENKKKKLIALSANIDKDGDIELYGISKGKYQAIRVVKKEALVNNSKVKAVYGNSLLANEMKSLIENDLDKERIKEFVEDIKSNETLTITSDIDSVILEKLKQKIEDKAKVISKDNMEKLNNKASILYKSKNGYKFLSIKKEGEDFLIEGTSQSLKEKDILENPSIKAIYGNTELAKSLKSLFKENKHIFNLSNKEETKNVIEEIKVFLKEKNKKNTPKIKR
jgi:hypothetical protein